MNVCLLPDQVNTFRQALKSKDLDMRQLFNMSTEERTTLFRDYAGDNAQAVNTLFEQKLVLKNQMLGLKNWASKMGEIGKYSPETKAAADKALADFRAAQQERIFNPSEHQSFLNDLADKKLGTHVSRETAGKVFELTQEADKLKEAIPEDSPKGSEERLAYGLAKVEADNYVGSLTAEKFGAKDYLKHPGEGLLKIAGTAKSLLSTLDNSFFGRQGIKVLFTNPDIWGNSLAKSWGDMAKELGGHDAMEIIKADVSSRPNALNGKYEAGGYALNLGSEEAFPEDLPSKIPGLGRIFKAAESAYNGAALRMRADLADRMIDQAEKFGVDMTDPEQARPIGEMVNAMTGRGNIFKPLRRADKPINSLFFSIRFLESNIDTLWKGSKALPEMALDKARGIEREPGEVFARQKAATNLLKITGSLAAIYATANLLSPGSVELDPRSSRFGKIKIGATTFDPTGGMAGLVTLAARILPSTNHGKLAEYTKNSKGKVTELGTGKFGAPSAIDVVNDFWEGKLAPGPALVRDLMKGEDFSGNRSYVKGHRIVPSAQELGNTVTPLPIQTSQDLLNNPKAAPFLIGMIADGLGISTYTPAPRK